ncbi:MAG TPA: lysylphosphatidylglycerol synthase transmembrane domain-containing protein [Rhodanobacteraceae bacterium]|nr:lysylphosphatidylglycerol synthase transmembrane domain-containing protein [Rhodanobacteraceae bacterium]
MLKFLSKLRHILKPEVVLPVLLAAALLVFAFNLGDLGKVMARLRNLPLHVIGISIGAAAVYLGCKAVQLRLMLKRIDVCIPPRSFWLAFAVGELTVTLPLGLFSQNWVMSASRRVNVGRSAGATVMMLLIEIAVVFLFLAVMGVRNWNEVRWIAVALMVLLVAFVAGAVVFEDKARELAGRVRREWLKKIAKGGVELLDGLRKLCTPHTIGVSLVLAAIYLGALTIAFWQIGRGMHVQHLDYWSAATIYAFSLAVILIGAGLISQIGTVDLLGMVIAQAYGIGYTDGLAMMLGFRIVWTGSIWILALPIVGATWREMPSHGKDGSDKDGTGKDGSGKNRSRDRGKKTSD